MSKANHGTSQDGKSDTEDDSERSPDINSPSEKAYEQCATTQYVIDTTARQLDGLRQCRITELTQKEILEAENELAKLFSKQIIAKHKLKPEEITGKLMKYPDMQQWLNVIGISSSATRKVLNSKVKMDTIVFESDARVAEIFRNGQLDDQDESVLLAACRKLRSWTELLLQDNKSTNKSRYEVDIPESEYLYSSPKGIQRPSTSSLPADAYYYISHAQHSPSSPPSPPQSTPSSPLPHGTDRKRFTPPPTPPTVKSSQSKKFPTTPPPQKRNKLYPDVAHPLTKSISHESQLSVKVNKDSDLPQHFKKKPGNLTLHGSSEAISPRRYSTEDGSEAGGSSCSPSGQTSPQVSSPQRSPPYNNEALDGYMPRKNQLVPPVSPGSRYMKHDISHRFRSKLVLGACDYCHKNILRGQVCKDCKAKFHRDCAEKAAPACGLPDELVKVFLDVISPVPNRREPDRGNLSAASSESSVMQSAASVPAFQPDSSSNTSSCNSSAPSSPALALDASSTPSSPAHHWPAQSPQIDQLTPSATKFRFPEVNTEPIRSLKSIDSTSSVTICLDDYNNDDSSKTDVINTNTSNDSDKSDRTIVESYSENRQSILERVDSQESYDEQSCRRVNSISVALKEWDIPYEQVKKGELIGTGRFGKVYHGIWHGDVAVKMLNTDPDIDNQAQLVAFKIEVATLRKTRHDNLILFMGACMKLPQLAIVTSLCKGQTLYTMLHVRKEKLNINRTVIIASQVAQGMGYLHAKGIVHKDVKSKNVFMEKEKVVITDFGLFSLTKLCHGRRKGNWLSIPPGWLYYLAPEIMCMLQAHQNLDVDLPMTEASDVYAFGTVWYELLCGLWPFMNQPPESIIWQVGKGIKQPLNALQASQDVKDILMLCWAYKPNARPSFGQLEKILEKLPKKRLARSPSHPIHLSRSAESVF